MTTCPCCDKTNAYADDDGAVDGPREFHAECWQSVDECFRFDEISGALYELRDNAYVHVFASPYCTSLDEAYRMYRKILAE